MRTSTPVPRGAAVAQASRHRRCEPPVSILDMPVSLDGYIADNNGERLRSEIELEIVRVIDTSGHEVRRLSSARDLGGRAS